MLKVPRLHGENTTGCNPGSVGATLQQKRHALFVFAMASGVGSVEAQRGFLYVIFSLEQISTN